MGRLTLPSEVHREHDAVMTIEELDLETCEELLGATPVGRVGFVHADQPVVLPVNHRYVDGEILFRTFTGQKFHAAKTRQHVAFEVDDWDRDAHTAWSVLIKGVAEEVIEWNDARDADQLGLEPWADPDAVGPWIRIVPESISGRRIG